MATPLVANTSKGEADAALQRLARDLIEVRKQINTLFEWRAPFDMAYMEGLGYTVEQVNEMTSFINIAAAWVEQIGAGGTMSANDGLVFERTLVQIYGLGGQAGIVTAPPPEEPPA